MPTHNEPPEYHCAAHQGTNMLGAVEHSLAYNLKRHCLASLLITVLGAGYANAPPINQEAPTCVSELELALSAYSPASQQRGADVEQRQHDLDLARQGLSSVISVQPSYSGERDLAKKGDPAEWGLGLQLDANLKYRYDLLDQLRTEAALHKAEQRYRDQRRADVLLALVTFSRLRVAERSAQSAEQNAVEAEMGLAGAEAASVTDASAGTTLDLREARFDARRARSNAESRHGDVSNLRTLLVELGALPPPPDNCHAPPRLPLLVPVAELGSNDAYIALLRAVALSEADKTRAALAPLRELAVSARYQEDGTRTTVQVGLAGGRPEASMEFRWRDVSTHAWSVGISANLRLDDSMGAALSTAQAAVTSAAAELTYFEADFKAALAQAEAVLADAYQELAFAEEARAIATERLALASSERDRSRAEQARLRMLDAYERAYQSYLRAVNDHLNEFGLAWADLYAP